MPLRRPIANFHPLPNDICEILEPLTRTQILVFHYILRHTWGFPDDDEREPKRLTFDAFLHGRETWDRKTGKLGRMDQGCGIPDKGNLSRALKALAMEHQLILIIEDRRDGGRVKKQYRVRMPEDEGYPDIIDLAEYMALRTKERELAESSRQQSTDNPELSTNNEELSTNNEELSTNNSIYKKETIERNFGNEEQIFTDADFERMEKLRKELELKL